ncbi:hypothetical protein BDV36DRAFT_192813 [Aspergillus pseudocaelatus]|uniref:Uncharacterized protein n=1 Tax=Aspergillus pseudocaelatus TaxID=1825620 RepID=A0ABQ6WIH5_9EURO|nr:hypothetical protein BDV36DRAFT_192813 [Aspergillus pseudocaelatus]
MNICCPLKRAFIDYSWSSECLIVTFLDTASLVFVAILFSLKSFLIAWGYCILSSCVLMRPSPFSSIATNIEVILI